MKTQLMPIGLIVALLGILLLPYPALAQNTKVSGYMFGDYYYLAASHNTDVEGSNGVWFRRIYLTLDQRVAEGWSARLRGEMSQPGDFATKAKMEPIVKDAYLKWNNDRHQVILGLSPTPTWGLVEKVWGYRAVEKTPLDFYKFGSSRDIGVAAKGKLDAAGKIQYHAMLANGGGTSSEVNEGKKAMLSLAYSPIPALTFEVYGDYEDRPKVEEDAIRFDTDRYTIQGALFFQKKAGRIGVQFAHQEHKQLEDNAQFDILSFFGAVRMTGKMHAFARYDRQFQPNPNGEQVAYCPFAATTEANFLVGGLDYAVTDKVHFMPNIEVVFYDEVGGVTPDTDIMPRLTFFFKF